MLCQIYGWHSIQYLGNVYNNLKILTVTLLYTLPKEAGYCKNDEVFYTITERELNPAHIMLHKTYQD